MFSSILVHFEFAKKNNSKGWERGRGDWSKYTIYYIPLDVYTGIKDEADLEEYNDYLLDHGDDDGEEGMDLFKIEDLEDEHEVDEAKFTHREFKEKF